MSNVVIPVYVESLEEGGFMAVCDAIQGCHAEGGTVAEALENLEEVATALLEVQKEDGVALPSGLAQFRAGMKIAAQLVVPVPE